MKKLKEIPKFKTEYEEREFWSKNDSTDFINWEEAKAIVLSNLKPTTKIISLRISDK